MLTIHHKREKTANEEIWSFQYHLHLVIWSQLHTVIVTCDVSQSECRLKKSGYVTEATEKSATHSKYTANETMKTPDRAHGIYKCFFTLTACRFVLANIDLRFSRINVFRQM